MRRADEELAVASGRRLPVEGDQAIVQHVAGFLERHRADAGHRTQIRQRLQDAPGSPQAADRQGTEALDPLAPRRLSGPFGERVHDRQRELTQVREVPEVALEPRDARRLRLVLLQLGDAVGEVGGQTVQSAAPPRLAFFTRAPADHRRLHDQLFPLPRRPQRPGHHGFIIGVDLRIGRADRIGPDVGWTQWSASPFLVGKHLVERHHQGGRRRGVRHLRHLAEREVLVETLGRQAVHRARQQRHERASRGIGPPGAAIEVDRHVAAGAGVLEQAQVLLRRAQKYRHLVERHTAPGLVEHAADDLDRFAPFTRGGEQHDVAGALALARALGLKHVAAQARQI